MIVAITKKGVITEEEVVTYKVLSGEFRSYVSGQANLQGWGHNADSSMVALARLLASKNIPFDFTEYFEIGEKKEN